MLKKALSLFQQPSFSLQFNSLTTSLKFFKSKRKVSYKQRVARYEAFPHMKKIAKLKMPNFRDPELTYPVNIPIRYTYVFRPSKSLPRIPIHDYINFTKLTGNEILLNLERSEHLRPAELSSALFELSRKPVPEGINWNEHEWVKKAVDVAKKNLAQWNSRSVAMATYGFHSLGINEPLLWSTLERECQKMVHRVTARQFAAIYISFLQDNERGTRDFRDRLRSLLPVHLRKMSAENIVKCFELTHKAGLMTEYLFEHHFFMLFWKRLHWFGPTNYVKIIRILADMKFDSDLEFWNKEFLPSIEKVQEEASEEEAKTMIQALRDAKEKIPGIVIDGAVKILEDRIVYVNTKLKAIENARFWNIVKNDIQYYKEKEKQKATVNA